MNHRQLLAPVWALAGLLYVTGCHQNPKPASGESLPSASVRLQAVETKDLCRLSSLVRAEIRKVRLEPKLDEASPAVGAALAEN